MNTNLIVYDRDMNKVAYLENAHNISYEMPFNSIWTASFSLPLSDEKNKECKPLYFVELYDGREYVGLFRILTSTTIRNSGGGFVGYQCEHVLATLLDDVLFQFHTVGNLGYYTSDVVEYILSKQTTTRWQLGTCDFIHQFEYTWENESLLSALFSVTNPFLNEYQWTFDTKSYPWTLNLVEPSNELDAYIRYGVNLQGIEKVEDPSSLCTRLYLLGYGEGVNQLNISDINDGLPYLDADTISQYGIVTKTLVDRRFESAETLKAWGQAYLEQAKVPYRSYRVDTAELYHITNDPQDKFKLGRKVRIKDEETNTDEIQRIVKLSKGDLRGTPGHVQLEIANKTQDITTSLADLQSRQRVNETHAQGATNVNVYNLAENCDSTHPAKFKIWIPEEAVRINKVLLTYENESFRANSKSLASAPATSSGPSSATTTASSAMEEVTTLNTWGTGIISDTPTGQPVGDLSDGASTHFHYIEAHEHTLKIPPHTHNMPHTHIIPSHTHDINFGIYEGATATSNGILVDGNLVPGSSTSAINLDLTNYLEVDDGGKIKRGQFHEIEIIPNRLSRIVATVVIQFFVQSRGGGDY